MVDIAQFFFFPNQNINTLVQFKVPNLPFKILKIYIVRLLYLFYPKFYSPICLHNEMYAHFRNVKYNQ